MFGRCGLSRRQRVGQDPGTPNPSIARSKERAQLMFFFCEMLVWEAFVRDARSRARPVSSPGATWSAVLPALRLFGNSILSVLQEGERSRRVPWGGIAVRWISVTDERSVSVQAHASDVCKGLRCHGVNAAEKWAREKGKRLETAYKCHECLVI